MFEDGEGRSLAATGVSRTGIAAEDANLLGGGTLPVEVADGSEEVGVSGRVSEAAGCLGGGLPDLGELGRRDRVALQIAVEGGLLGGAGELDDDAADLGGKSRMTDEGETKVGIDRKLPVCFTEGNDVDVIKGVHEGADNRVEAGGFGGEVKIRRLGGGGEDERGEQNEGAHVGWGRSSL